MAIKLLISDLDGTLLGPDGNITARTAAALLKAQQKGLRLLVATGRSWKTASPILQRVGVACDCVLLNGAEYRTAEGILRRAVTLSAPDARRAVAILQQHKIGYEINSNLGDFSTDTTLCGTAEPMPEWSEFWSLEPQVAKIFGFSKNPMALARAYQRLHSLPALTVTASAPWNLEVTARDAQKGRMALWAAAQFGVNPEEVLVFGDSNNDVSLFQPFVHTCAMGNAVEPLRNRAEKVIESNIHDGVAREIERLLGEPS